MAESVVDFLSFSGTTSDYITKLRRFRGAEWKEIDSSYAQEANRVYNDSRVFEVKKEIRVESWFCEGHKPMGTLLMGEPASTPRRGIS